MPAPSLATSVVTLKTATGLSFQVYRAEPATPPNGGVIVLHEAFGVTPHICRMTEHFAAHGYLALAPVLFAHATGQPAGRVLPQNKLGLEEGRDLILATPPAAILAMVQTVSDHARAAGLASAAVGYCWGGSCAYAAGAALPELRAVVSYYGGQMARLAAEAQPSCPTLVYLAAHDRYIPLEEARTALATHHPTATVRVIDADHGFNRDDGVTYAPARAAEARTETLAFLQQAFQRP